MSEVILDEIRNKQLRVPRGQETDQVEFTGERFLPGYRDGSIDLLHFHRYSFALQFVAGKKVLDIACGDGYGCELMGQVAREVIGVDIDALVIDRARTRYTQPNLSFRTASTSAIPLENESIDVVVSFETIEHLHDQDAFWCEIKRVLRKRGILLISSPNRNVYNQQRIDKNPFHINELSKEELVQELSERFAYHQLFSQANVFGSFLMPVSPGSIAPSLISVDPTTRVLSLQAGFDSIDPFSVAVASDEPLPALGQSLYTGDYPPDAMSALTGGIAERDEHVQRLRAQIADFERVRNTQVAAAQRERDEALESAKQREEHLLKEKQLLVAERDKAVREAERVRETLAEQCAVIRALQDLVDEYTKHSVRSDADAVRAIEQNASSENGD